jgi:hypothetical protein
MTAILNLNVLKKIFMNNVIYNREIQNNIPNDFHNATLIPQC